MGFWGTGESGGTSCISVSAEGVAEGDIVGLGKGGWVVWWGMNWVVCRGNGEEVVNRDAVATRWGGRMITKRWECSLVARLGSCSLCYTHHECSRTEEKLGELLEEDKFDKNL
jgi:hypothetical protein